MRRIFRYLFVVISVLGMFSCEKEDMNFGAGFLDDDDVLYAFLDTTSVPMSFMTVVDDTLRTTKITYMLGKAKINGIGEVNASFLSKFYYNNSSLLFVDTSNYSIDSIVLEMGIRRQYLGDSASNQTITVNQLKSSYTYEDVKKYAQNLTTPSCIGDVEKLGTISFKPSFDTAKSYKDSVGFRYKFEQSKAQELFTNIKSNYNIDASLFILDSLLQKHFAGLYITSENAKGILNFAPQIVFYGHNSKGNASITLLPSTVSYSDESTYKVILAAATKTEKEVSYIKNKRDLYVQSFTIFEHTYNSDIQNTLNKVSDESYISGFNGLRTRIMLPQLNNWKDSAVVYNSVKLYIPVERVSVASQSSTQTLYLQIRDKNKAIVSTLIPVYSKNNMFVYNFTYFMNEFKVSSYKSEDYYFELVMPDNNVYGNVCKINTVNPEKYNFVIKYSK